MKIFLLEDDFALNKIIKISLQNRGFFVDSFTDGYKAVDAILNSKHDLYYLSKKEKRVSEISNINLVRFLSSRLAFFDEMANVKNIDISLDIHEEFDILMDSYELERVIDNTLSNAIKYSFEDSNIDIILGFTDNIYKLEIKNEGIKIADTKAIFNAYYQQKDKNIGFGLGLSIVKEICDKYEIKIEVNSLNNQTSFSYIFPENLIFKGKDL